MTKAEPSCSAFVLRETLPIFAIKLFYTELSEKRSALMRLKSQDKSLHIILYFSNLHRE